MNDMLSKILLNKKEALIKQKQLLSENALLERIPFLAATKDFKNCLNIKLKAKEIALISEIKKAAPGKGIIRKSFSPTRIAKAYEQAGSVAISVITEESVYLGKSEYLKETRVSSNLPIIRKDFIFDPYQVIESRVLGADAILLTMTYLSIDTAKELEELAVKLGMDVLIEIHDEKELEKAQNLSSKLICINNRSLKTLEVDLDITKNLVNIIDKDYVIICENGIQSIDNIKELNKYNIYSFIIGEYILSKPNIKNAIQVLLK
jgi:indole-3-glycerol phosphate synthase